MTTATLGDHLAAQGVETNELYSRGARVRKRETAVDANTMLAGLMRRNGESWGDLLLRLDEAVMQSVVENRVISDLQV